MDKTLSLCIPTFNRARLLEESLGAVLSQVKDVAEGQVEVLVLDNASSDDTPAVVAQMQANFPQVCLRSIRRPENIGGDANFCTAPALAQGQFVYLLSDDDILLPGAVATLLELIQKHPELDAFALNVRQFRDDPEEEGEQPFNLEHDMILQDRDQALLLLNTHIIFISALVFRRERVLGRDYTARYATHLAQAFMFLDVLAPNHGLYATSQPYLAQRADRARGYDFFRVWVTNFYSVMQYAKQTGYSTDAIHKVMRQHLYFINHYVLTFKSKDTYSEIRPSEWSYLGVLVKLLQIYGLNKYLVFTIMPRMLTPRSVYSSLKRLYRSIIPQALSEKSR